MRMQVVLPQPDGPTMATNSRSCTSRLMSFERDEGLAVLVEHALHVLELDVGHRRLLVGSRQRPRRFSISLLHAAQRHVDQQPTTPMATMPHITVAVEMAAWPLTIR